jgi:dihydroxy-acid dehydratase
MGTASTMACLVETLGMMLPGGASIPAVYADRMRCAEESGKLAVQLIQSQLTPAQIMTRPAFENALRVLQAIGGSTNAVIHLTALAGRLGIRLELDQLDQLAASTPVLVDLKPTGVGYMEDFHRSGGLRVVLQELKPLLHLDVRTVTGQTLGQLLDTPYTFPSWQQVIRPATAPLQAEGALIVLRGNLAPDGALLKRSAATPALLHKSGRAVVFNSLADLAARIDHPDLDVTPDDFLVLQNAGPLGGPGMPEAGYLPIPKKLAAAGVTDMVRISDARMSGTAFGTVVLHVAPEAAVGGPLGLVRTGDRIELDVDARRLTLQVSEEELAARRAAQPLPPPWPPTAMRRFTSATANRPTWAQISIFCTRQRPGDSARQLRLRSPALPVHRAPAPKADRERRKKNRRSLIAPHSRSQCYLGVHSPRNSAHSSHSLPSAKTQ